MVNKNGDYFMRNNVRRSAKVMVMEWKKIS